ncbi:MAG: NuoM family protein [Bacteroidota bacterium]
MIALLLVLIPLLGGGLTLFLPRPSLVRPVALSMALLSLAAVLLGLTRYGQMECWSFDSEWIQAIGALFTLKGDVLARWMSLLSAIGVLLAILGSWDTARPSSNRFYGLLLWMQAGMSIVFLSSDALLFYFGWELALIPAYFLSSIWGGEKRIEVTIKFFLYTFAGSVLMLIGLIYLHGLTADGSFQWQSFRNLELSESKQVWLFWLFFLAFAIKVPIFPLHTWQPDAYEQAPTPVTLLLSGVMVKMGVVAMIRWLLPMMGIGVFIWSDVVICLSVVGIIYASLIAIRQDDLKRLIAYSSIAHMGLTVAALFSLSGYSNNSNVVLQFHQVGFQGVLLQLFSHGVNIMGMWLLADRIESRFGTHKLSELGGLARTAPTFSIFFLIIALANIALPLTNVFPGEFLQFNAIFHAQSPYRVFFLVLSGLGVILSAIYTLNMIRRIFYGETNSITENGLRLSTAETLALTVVVALVLVFGIYPQAALDLTNDFSWEYVKSIDITRFLAK